MCGAILGFFGNLFSDESKYIKAQMEMEQRMAMEKKKQYEVPTYIPAAGW